ncbi:MAG: hypothetical protein AAF383_06755 [Cyanobacteria bacterium P01_A01_bin.83]
MTLYLSGAGAYCAFLLFCKFNDQECSKTDPASWLVVVIASALWMIVIPISFMEIRSKAKAKAQLESIIESRQPEAIAQPIKITEKSSELDSTTLGQLKPSNS